MATEYKKLDKNNNYDVEASQELAAAINEALELESRLKYVKSVVNDNKPLHRFIWTTAEGKAIAFRDIEQDHFVNILSHIANRGDNPSDAIIAEATRRGVPIPEKVPQRTVRARILQRYAESTADEYDDWDEPEF